MAEPPSVDADFVAFFTTMLPKAVATARRITGDRASAEDAAAEGLARAYVRWSKLRTVSYREAWVLRVTANQAIGMYRTRTRRAGILRRQPHPETPAGETGGAGWDARDRLVGSIRRLPRRQRDVVALRYFSDMSTEQVAAALGISTGSVKTHLHRAMHTLRQRLDTDTFEGMLE